MLDGIDYIQTTLLTHHNETGTYYLRDIDFKTMSQLKNRIEYEKYSITFIEADNLSHILVNEDIDEEFKLYY